jgi:hypothetical protein
MHGPQFQLSSFIHSKFHVTVLDIIKLLDVELVVNSTTAVKLLFKTNYRVGLLKACLGSPASFKEWT